jgi:hypothetical protein
MNTNHHDRFPYYPDQSIQNKKKQENLWQLAVPTSISHTTYKKPQPIKPPSTRFFPITLVPF